jgi:hypothetical protein
MFPATSWTRTRRHAPGTLPLQVRSLSSAPMSGPAALQGVGCLNRIEAGDISPCQASGGTGMPPLALLPAPRRQG